MTRRERAKRTLPLACSAMPWNMTLMTWTAIKSSISASSVRWCVSVRRANTPRLSCGSASSHWTLTAAVRSTSTSIPHFRCAMPCSARRLGSLTYSNSGTRTSQVRSTRKSSAAPLNRWASTSLRMTQRSTWCSQHLTLMAVVPLRTKSSTPPCVKSKCHHSVPFAVPRVAQKREASARSRRRSRSM